MKCPECGTENMESAGFCRDCGCNLRPKNVVDRYPEYGFIPTNLEKWKQPTTARRIHRVTVTLCTVAWIIALWCVFSFWNYNVTESKYNYYDGSSTFNCKISDKIGLFSGGSWNDNTAEEAYEYAEYPYQNSLTIGFSLGMAGGLLMLFFSYRTKRHKPSQKAPKLNDVADYVQSYTYTGLNHSHRKPLYKFFVKNGKFGLLDVTNYCVKIPAKYVKLGWREQNRSLTAYDETGEFVIDINGNPWK